MKLFRPNLDTTGRLIRAASAVTLAVGAVSFWPQSSALSAVMAVSSLFVAFEAARGWCVLRACGVKTKF